MGLRKHKHERDTHIYKINTINTRTCATVNMWRRYARRNEGTKGRRKRVGVCTTIGIAPRYHVGSPERLLECDQTIIDPLCWHARTHAPISGERNNLLRVTKS